MTNFSTPPPPPPPAPMGMTTAAKPPRPTVTIGAGLLVVGGALMIVGSLLNWFEIDGDRFNGFSNGVENADGTKDGPIFAVLAGIAILFGIIQLASRKVLALGILGVATCAFGLIAAVADLSDVNDAVDEIKLLIPVDASTGPGLYVVVAGAAIAIVGSLATIAKRRA